MPGRLNKCTTKGDPFDRDSSAELNLINSEQLGGQWSEISAIELVNDHKDGETRELTSETNWIESRRATELASVTEKAFC